MKCKEYKICLWSGIGYHLDAFNISAYSEQHAIEVLVAELIADGNTQFFETEEDFYALVDDGDVFIIGEDCYEGWMYVDATREGAPYPVFLRTENMNIKLLSNNQ